MTIPAPTLILAPGLTDIVDGRLTVTRSTTGYRFNGVNALVSAAANTGRIEYERLSARRLGLLCEGAVTERLLQTEDLSNASWTKTNCSIVADQSTGPDGNTTLDKVTENSAASTTHSCDQDITITATNAVVASCYVAPNSRTAMAIQMLGATDGGRAHFDLTGDGSATNETVASGSVLGSGIKLTKSGLYYCWACMKIGAADTTCHVKFMLKNGTGNSAITYTGDGASNLYLGFLNACTNGSANGINPGQYIPATTVTVTTATDNISMATSPWFRSDEGTVIVHFRTPKLMINNVIGALFSIDDTTVNERYQVDFQGSQVTMRVVDGGVSQVATTSGSVLTADTDAKLAFAYKVNDFAMCTGGGTVSTDSSGTLPTPTALRLGLAVDLAAANSLFGTIFRLAYYPARITNADMQALTS